MPRWIALLSTLAVALAAACAPAPRGDKLAKDFIVLSRPDGLTGLDFGSGRVAYQTPNAIASPDWSKLYISNTSGLSLLDGLSGAVQGSVGLPEEDLAVSAVSTDGARVALVPSGETDGGREQSRIIVADTSGRTRARTYHLTGNYAPDAFSSDDQALFVLEYQPPTQPDHYRVRRLDLRNGVVSAVGSRQKLVLPEEDMRGTRHSQILSADRSTLYTLYTNQPEHLHSRDLAAGRTQSSNDYYAFVHVLNLTEGWAYCLDLPQPFGVGPASAHAMALSADGQWLYVADRSSGAVAVADTRQLTLRTMGNVGGNTDSPAAFAAVGADYRLLLSDTTDVLILDPKSLRVVKRLPIGATPTGMALSADGQRLFISTAEKLIALDPTSGFQLGSIASRGAAGVLHVGTLR